MKNLIQDSNKNGSPKYDYLQHIFEMRKHQVGSKI